MARSKEPARAPDWSAWFPATPREAEVERLKKELEESRVRERRALRKSEETQEQFRRLLKSNRRLLHTLRERRDRQFLSQKRLIAQHAVDLVLSESEDLANAAAGIVEALGKSLDCQSAVLWTVDEAEGVLRCEVIWQRTEAGREEFETACQEMRFVGGEGLPGRAWADNRLVWSENLEQDADLGPDKTRAEGLRSALAFPIRSGRRTFGVIELLDAQTFEPDKELHYPLELVGKQIGRFVERWRTEKELEESRRLFRRIADTTPDILYLYDLTENRNVYVNRGVEEILGYTAEQIAAMGSNLMSLLLHPEDRRSVSEVIRNLNALRDGETREVEYRMRHADGPYRWLRSHETVFSRTPEGQARQVLGLAQDVTGRKEAEETLAASEEWLRLATHAGRVGIVEWNVQTNKGRGSDVLAEIYGYAPGTYNPTYEEFLERVHPEDRGRVRDTLDAAVAACEPHELEFRIVRPDGEVRRVHSKGRVHQDEKGEPVRVVGITLDITDRKRVEEERDRFAREAEAERARLETILQQMPAGVIVADVSGRLLMGNDAASHIHGQPIEPVEYIHDYKRWEVLYVDGTPLPPERYPLARALDGEAVSGEEYLIPNPGGTTRVVIANAAPLRDYEGRVNAAVVTFSDVTELRRIRERLANQKHFFETTLQQAADAILACDAEGRLTFANAAAQRMALLDPQGTTLEISSEVWGRAYYPDGRPIPVEELSLIRALRGETTTGREKRIVRPDGSFYDVFISAAPVRGAGGEITGAVASFTNITERKKAEEDRLRLRALEAAGRAEAAERNRISRELHDRVAHSMGVIHQSLQLYEALAEKEPGHARERLYLAKETVKTALEQTRNLSMELRRSETEDGLIPALQDLLEVAVPEGVSVKLSASGEEELLSDQHRGQLYLILREAVRNAVKHSGGSRISVGLDITPEEVSGYVEDNGCGLDVTGEANGNGAARHGHGLGLQTMQERATLVGGWSRTYPAPEGGTGVEVRVPLDTKGGVIWPGTATR